MEGWQWLATAIGSGLTLFLGSKLVADYFQRRWKLRDGQIDISIATEGKRIDADANAFQAVMKRLETVEARQDGLQTQLSQEMQRSAALEERNRSLTIENERQAKKLHQFAHDLQERDLQIRDLTQTIHGLEIKIAAFAERLNKREGGQT